MTGLCLSWLCTLHSTEWRCKMTSVSFRDLVDLDLRTCSGYLELTVAERILITSVFPHSRLWCIAIESLLLNLQSQTISVIRNTLSSLRLGSRWLNAVLCGLVWRYAVLGRCLYLSVSVDASRVYQRTILPVAKSEVWCKKQGKLLFGTTIYTQLSILGYSSTGSSCQKAENWPPFIPGDPWKPR